MTNPSGERPIVGAMTSQANDQAGQAAPGRCLSRRDAIRLLLAAGAGAAGLALACSPRVARADTSSDLAGAEAELAEAQAQLDAIAADYEALSVAHAETLGRIDDLQADIDALQEDIDERQAELEEKQEVLASRVASVYKGGNVDLLNILLESSSFDELTSNIYYFERISESDAALIEDVRSAKEELEAQQAELEAEQDELEQLSADEQAQLDEMQANQQQVQDVVNGLDSEVRDLMAQRDAELAASVQEAASAGGSGGGGGGSHVSNPPASGSGSLAAVVNACHSTPSPGARLVRGVGVQRVQQRGPRLRGRQRLRHVRRLVHELRTRANLAAGHDRGRLDAPLHHRRPDLRPRGHLRRRRHRDGQRGLHPLDQHLDELGELLRRHRARPAGAGWAASSCPSRPDSGSPGTPRGRGAAAHAGRVLVAQGVERGREAPAAAGEDLRRRSGSRA